LKSRPYRAGSHAVDDVSAGVVRIHHFIGRTFILLSSCRSASSDIAMRPGTRAGREARKKRVLWPRCG
jgi:hypothetical protein